MCGNGSKALASQRWRRRYSVGMTAQSTIDATEPATTPARSGWVRSSATSARRRDDLGRDRAGWLRRGPSGLEVAFQPDVPGRQPLLRPRCARRALRPGSILPYEVRFDGELVWPIRSRPVSSECHPDDRAEPAPPPDLRIMPVTARRADRGPDRVGRRRPRRLGAAHGGRAGRRMARRVADAR